MGNIMGNNMENIMGNIMKNIISNACDIVFMTVRKILNVVELWLIMCIEPLTAKDVQGAKGIINAANQPEITAKYICAKSHHVNIDELITQVEKKMNKTDKLKADEYLGSLKIN
jgi:hypothetical protein